MLMFGGDEGYCVDDGDLSHGHRKDGSDFCGGVKCALCRSHMRGCGLWARALEWGLQRFVHP